MVGVMRPANQTVSFLMSTILTFYLIALLTFPALASSLPDPTRPPSNYKGSEEQKKALSAPETIWRVELILVSESRKMTLINGQKKRVGDVVAGAKIVSIKPTGVTLDYNGKRFTVRILPDIIENKNITGNWKKRNNYSLSSNKASR